MILFNLILHLLLKDTDWQATNALPCNSSYEDLLFTIEASFAKLGGEIDIVHPDSMMVVM